MDNTVDNQTRINFPPNLIDSVLSLTENNEHLALAPEHSAKYEWDWVDDCGLQLTKMDNEWFAHIRARYHDFLNQDDLPLLTEEDLRHVIRSSLERLQVRIPSDSFLHERLVSMAKARSRETQSLLCVLAERSYAYAVLNIFDYPPEKVQQDLSCTLQVVTNPIWCHTVFGV